MLGFGIKFEYSNLSHLNTDLRHQIDFEHICKRIGECVYEGRDMGLEIKRMDMLYTRKMTLNCKNYRRKESKTSKLKKRKIYTRKH